VFFHFPFHYEKLPEERGIFLISFLILSHRASV
jgi:hypothetical protein